MKMFPLWLALASVTVLCADQLTLKTGSPLVISRNGERKELKITLHSVPPTYKDNPYAEPQSVKASLGPQAVGNLKISLFPGKIGIDLQIKWIRSSLVNLREPKG